MTKTCSQEQNQPVREKRMQDYLAYDMSLSIARSIGAGPNICFDNILTLFKFLPDAFTSLCTFIEGWYVVDLEDEVVINEHCWCEIPDGRIVDPTVVFLVSPDQPVYYFSGVKRSQQEVKEITQKKDAWFPYVRGIGTYGEDGLEHPGYKAAYEEARQKVFSLANVRQPAKRTTFLTAQDMAGDQGSVQVFIISTDQQKKENGF